MAETPVLKFRLHESARTFAGSSCGDASHRANKSVSKRFYCAEEKGVFVFADGTYSIVHVREPAAGFLKYSANAMSKAKLKQADEKAAMLAAGEEEKKKSPIAPVTVAKAGTTSMDGVEFALGDEEDADWVLV
ncbi:hypothetical protein B0A50_04461 [Salinomyces thailandicus]|uniref:Uncharacterized protein n=1 Tax=Salinomyces thailandicus TaxID=706561 RepID=A0A4V5N4G3_9PEZI|nr:hypothetical protein B0A50_04461 [Salinomyces thailandica]